MLKYMLTYDFVKSVVDSELNPKIQDARDMSDKLRLHVDGVGLQRYLAKINNYENDAQFSAREKHAISNKFLTEELLRPTDNAFNARGGSKNYKFEGAENKQDDFVKKLVDVRDHSSLSDYIENVWFNKYVTDPNGLIFMEIKTIEDDENKIEPCYKSIHSIRDYKQNGIFIDWVIFEPHETDLDKENPKDEKKAKKTFWAVDSEFYYLYQYSNEGLVLLDSIENSFDKVPAILCSNIIDNVTGWKKSPIDSQVELLDKYLVSNSVLSISEFFHNYLREWTYVDECAKCNGTGNIGDDETECDKCDGSGKSTKKDVTDVLELKIPDSDGVKIDPPSGYIYAPTDAWTSQINSVDRTWNIVFFSHWGTSQEKEGNETATGRFIDVQPVNNRLDKYSKSIEMAHTALANFLGQFYYPETFERAFIQYGRRYLIETPDQIWDKYIKAKSDMAPVSTLDLLLGQFLESEFRENEMMLVYEVKKSKLEPFVHWDIVTVKGLGVYAIDYQKKLYFGDWIQTKSIKEITETDLDKLETEFTDWVTKNKNNTNLNNNQNE